MTPRKSFVVAEWSSIVTAYPAANQLMKLDRLSLLDLFPVFQGAVVGLFQSPHAAPDISGDLMLSKDLRDCCALDWDEGTVLNAFHGLTNHLLQSKHALGIVQTSSVPLGFAIAHFFAQTLGPQSLLECKMGRGNGGGTQLFIGADSALLSKAISEIESSLQKVRYQKLIATTWDASVVNDPHPDLRKRFAFL